MADENPFSGLVAGRLRIWLDEAFVEWRARRIRGTYDYAMLALNATFFELKARGRTLFERLEGLEAGGRIGPEVLAFARSREFLVRHDRGITDMDLSYLSTGEVRDFLGLLACLCRSLAERGVVPTGGGI